MISDVATFELKLPTIGLAMTAIEQQLYVTSSSAKPSNQTQSVVSTHFNYRITCIAKKKKESPILICRTYEFAFILKGHNSRSVMLLLC